MKRFHINYIATVHYTAEIAAKTPEEAQEIFEEGEEETDYDVTETAFEVAQVDDPEDVTHLYLLYL